MHLFIIYLDWTLMMLSFTDEDGSVVTITKEDFWNLMAKDGSPHEIRKLYNIGPRHLNCYYSERQRVKLAVQILSMSFSNAFQMKGGRKESRELYTRYKYFWYFILLFYPIQIQAGGETRIRGIQERRPAELAAGAV